MPKQMDQIVSLCKRRGFIFQSSEIYGGLQGFWDYGPLGTELKRNVREAWYGDMVTHARRYVGTGRRAVGISDGGRGMFDHHASTGVEGVRPLRLVPRLHGRLQRMQGPLSRRSRPHK